MSTKTCYTYQFSKKLMFIITILNPTAVIDHVVILDQYFDKLRFGSQTKLFTTHDCIIAKYYEYTSVNNEHSN